MLTEEAQRRQEKLKNYLFEMSKSYFDEDGIKQVASELKELYTSNFRHNYSEFFNVVLDIAKYGDPYNLDYLSNNLEAIRIHVENDYIDRSNKFIGLYKPLVKLCDHVNLEIARYNYYSMNEQRINDSEKRGQMLQDELKRTTDALMESHNKVSSLQTELIAVLSIFAAIVLAFSGGFNFLGNALSGASVMPILKSAFFTILCGIVLFNTIFMMLYMVGKITGRNIYARCQSENCSCGRNGKPKCSGINRIRKRLPYAFWFNVVLLSFILADVALWLFVWK